MPMLMLKAFLLLCLLPFYSFASEPEEDDFMDRTTEQIATQDQLKDEFSESIFLHDENIFNHKPFVFKVLKSYHTIMPYAGFGYAFTVGGYTGSPSSTPYLFNNVVLNAGFVLDKHFVFEVGGLVGGPSYLNGNSATLNALRINVGWMFGEEMLGEYADKNRIILLAGVAIGMSGYDINGKTGNAFISVSPEVALAYERCIVSFLWARFEARATALKVVEMSSSIAGTFSAGLIFRL